MTLMDLNNIANMRKIIEIISRNGVSAGPDQKAVLHIPTTEETSSVFNTAFNDDDSLSLETDGHTVTVTIVNSYTALQENLDKRIAAKLLDYFFFGGLKSSMELTKSFAN
jgi:hypothetical protein